jgi:hypothetical protein
MEQLSIRDAAEHCGVGVELIRKRVDRGTLQSVKQGNMRFIPRSELERAGLWPGTRPDDVERLQAELAQARDELATLRVLPAQVDTERRARELAEQALIEERAERTSVVAQLAEIEAAHAAASATVERLSTGTLLERWRARRELRTAAAATPAPGPADVAPAA